MAPGRASGHRGESPAQAATDRPAPCSPPNLTRGDRLLCGFWSLFLSPERIRKVALAIRPSTLLAFHRALVRRKYGRPVASRPCPKKPGPKGPDEALIQAVVELKSRNPRFGCPRIARIICQTFGLDIDKHVVNAAGGIYDGMPRAGLCRVVQCPPGSIGAQGVADAA